MSLKSGGTYFIQNLGATHIDWTAFVNVTQQNSLEMGPNNPPTKWTFTQPNGEGGMWTIQDTITNLYIGYISPAANYTNVQAVNASEEIYWDIWPTHPAENNHYQIFVPKTFLSATVFPTSEVVESISIFYATTAYEHDYQNWCIATEVQV